ncbi:uncharacterized protein LOC112131959 [Pongo abelii]|uniref:uncharacterized protein LOC112131959 n=1 Tax=Pongo abelii TaxID=9601 RepID=UPI0030078021
MSKRYTLGMTFSTMNKIDKSVLFIELMFLVWILQETRKSMENYLPKFEFEGSVEYSGETNPSRDLERQEDSAGCAACAWNLVFCKPGLLSLARGCRDSPGLAPRTAPGILQGWEGGAGSLLPPQGGAAGLPGTSATGGPGGRACRLQDVRAPRPAAGAAGDPPLLAAVPQRPAVPGRGLRDRKLRVLGRHQRGAQELDSASTEEAMPALQEDSGSIWQQSFPASAHKEDAHLRPRAGAARARPPPAPPGVFSYRREGGQAAGAPRGSRLRAATARSLAHASVWGCLATVSAHEKIQGLPFGNCLPISDGPFNNSTGIPFFYTTAKDPVVADLMKNPMASLMLPESEGEFCRNKFVESDMKPVCKKCYEKFPLELKKRLKKLAETLGRKFG